VAAEEYTYVTQTPNPPPNFGSCDLEIHLISFVYDLGPYSLEIYGMCENELLASRLSKVIIL